ncbi:hypothetical protein Tsubulata_026156 [Turnera subulata]|uniref:Pectate lyase superfamily protein domain-containing protein n=1 Tax=Turnera subulata TaxID=218843 RepID=A0A9Q0J4C2_9ROSI|nr:hypothetical protein Tsubulata_026156 [Turnera subulata]
METKYQPVASYQSPFSSLNLDSYFEPDTQVTVYSQNRTIDDLIKSGQLSTARELFDEMPMCDVVTYNLLISGYGKFGIPKQALYLYREMVSLGMRENPSTFSSVLSICGNAGFCTEGTQAHCRVVKLGYSSNLFIGSSLVGLYIPMGFDELALMLFYSLPERNLAGWNLVLRGFCELGRFDQVLGLYNQMKSDGVEANGLSFSYLIRGCCNDRFLNEGKELHCHVIKSGWLDSNIFVANALVDFYAACDSLDDAEKSFEAIPLGDVLSWNSMVSLYTNNGLIFDALKLFHMMQQWGKRPSIRSFVGLLNLSSMRADILLGQQIHCCVLKTGFQNGSSYVQSALIDMYGKCKDIESSVLVYESSPEKTIDCCNPLMTSLLHCGLIEDVVEMFGLMVDQGIGLDEVTVSTTLKALSVSSLASLACYSVVHGCAIKSGLESDNAVSCSLIDAYSKSGHVELSRKVFDHVRSPNVICFTSIIKGYARNGLGRECLEMLEQMTLRDLKPDKVTFLCVLTGCSHAGLVEEGRFIFDSMKTLHGISPGREHFSCMVDLLGRAGLFNEAQELLEQSPGKHDCVMWSSLLRSCRVHKNESVGRRAAEMLLQLDPQDFAVYLQISNFYSEIGEFEASSQVREIAMARKMTREIGISLLENRQSQNRQSQAMDKLFILSFFGFLIVAHGVAGNMEYDNIGLHEELESFDIEEEYEVELPDTSSWTTSERGSKVLVNVDSFGAVGDGISDDTQAFVSAWEKACNTTKSVFFVPQGRRYLVNATKFKGPCADKLVIQIDGTIVAPDEPSNWDPNLSRLWLDFSKLNGALTIDSCSAVKVQGLTIQNSQQMHFVISKSDSVRISGVLVSAPGDSPNTDGIHITQSTNLQYQDEENLLWTWTWNQDNSTGIVTKVVVDTAFLRETTNGLRIKTWQGGNGYVRGVRYENVQMDNVANPIIIDQFYCDSPKSCQNQTENVKISQIMYRNISGTTKSEKAMKFACSDTVPCSNIVLTNVNLEKEDGTVETYCNSAEGFGYGIVHPSADCLSSHDDKDYGDIGEIETDQDYPVIGKSEVGEPHQSASEDIVHTEL